MKQAHHRQARLVLILTVGVMLLALPIVSRAWDETVVSSPYGSAKYDVSPTLLQGCQNNNSDDCFHLVIVLSEDIKNSEFPSDPAVRLLIVSWYSRQLCEKMDDVPACIVGLGHILNVTGKPVPQFEDVFEFAKSQCASIVVHHSNTDMTMRSACEGLGFWIAHHGDEKLGDSFEVNACNFSPEFSDHSDCIEAGEPAENAIRRTEAEEQRQRAQTDRLASDAAQRAADEAAQSAAVDKARSSGEAWLECSAANSAGGDSVDEVYFFKDKALSSYNQGALYPMAVNLQPNFIYFDEVYAGSTLVWHKIVDRVSLAYTVTHEASVSLVNPDGSYVFSSPGVIAVHTYTAQLNGTCKLIGAQQLKQNVL